MRACLAASEAAQPECEDHTQCSGDSRPVPVFAKSLRKDLGRKACDHRPGGETANDRQRVLTHAGKREILVPTEQDEV